MPDLAIHCEGLSKRYRLGERESYKALRDVIADVASRPMRHFRSASRNGNQKSDTHHSSLITHDSGHFWALDNVSFDVKRGEVLGIIGRNGAGKSTLLKILSRITKPTRGHAEIHGRVASLLEVGTGFHPELTGRENIYLNAAILGMRRAEVNAKFDEIVAFAEVEKFIDTPVKRYSSGMYVRLAFSVAAHLEPEILIIDEVLAVGDAAFQKKCLGRMGEVARGGRTVLFVSHNMGAIRNLCSAVLWLDGGRVKSQGPAATIVDQYLQSALHHAGYSIDLSNVQRVGGGAERLKIESIQFNDGQPVLHGEPLLVEIGFTTLSPIDDAAFGFGFSSLEGIRLMSVDSDLLEPQRFLPNGHSGSVAVTIPLLQLQPGYYSIDLGARSGNNNSLDYLAGFAQIEVLPGPNTPPLIIRESGGVRVPGEWLWSDSLMLVEEFSDEVV